MDHFSTWAGIQGLQSGLAPAMDRDCPGSNMCSRLEEHATCIWTFLAGQHHHHSLPSTDPTDWTGLCLPQLQDSWGGVTGSPTFHMLIPHTAWHPPLPSAVTPAFSQGQRLLPFCTTSFCWVGPHFHPSAPRGFTGSFCRTPQHYGMVHSVSYSRTCLFAAAAFYLTSCLFCCRHLPLVRVSRCNAFCLYLLQASGTHHWPGAPVPLVVMPGCLFHAIPSPTTTFMVSILAHTRATLLYFTHAYAGASTCGCLRSCALSLSLLTCSSLAPIPVPPCSHCNTTSFSAIASLPKPPSWIGMGCALHSCGVPAPFAGPLPPHCVEFRFPHWIGLDSFSSLLGWVSCPPSPPTFPFHLPHTTGLPHSLLCLKLPHSSHSFTCTAGSSCSFRPAVLPAHTGCPCLSAPASPTGSLPYMGLSFYTFLQFMNFLTYSPSFYGFLDYHSGWVAFSPLVWFWFFSFWICCSPTITLLSLPTLCNLMGSCLGGFCILSHTALTAFSWHVWCGFAGLCASCRATFLGCLLLKPTFTALLDLDLPSFPYHARIAAAGSLTCWFLPLPACHHSRMHCLARYCTSLPAHLPLHWVSLLYLAHMARKISFSYGGLWSLD